MNEILSDFMKPMATVYIGVGANLGNREKQCQTAITRLASSGIRVLKVSSMINTAPWGLAEQPEFINMAIKIETALAPHALLCLLKETERIMGRTSAIRWGPRLIDLDILFYNDLILTSPDLEIPHPRIKDRYFVLKPLSEIAPDLVHPVLKKSIRELLAELNCCEP